jgi:hypothetical protein
MIFPGRLERLEFSTMHRTGETALIEIKRRAGSNGPQGTRRRGCERPTNASDKLN